MKFQRRIMRAWQSSWQNCRLGRGDLLRLNGEDQPDRNLGLLVRVHPKVAAEVFAALSPANNQKLKQDIAKVQAVKADHRYVFYCSPGAHDEGKVPGDVRVIRFEVEEITDGKTFPGLPN